MKYLIVLTVVLFIAISGTSAGLFGKKKKEHKINEVVNRDAVEFQKKIEIRRRFVFDTRWAIVNPDLFEGDLFVLNKAIADKKFLATDYEKEVIFELVGLRKLTDCSEENFEKFRNAYEKYEQYQNMKVWLYEQWSGFEERCKKSGYVPTKEENKSGSRHPKSDFR